MKKALGLLVALGAMSLMSVSAYAATYSVESASAKAGDTVTLTLKAAADSASSTVNGYALNIAYDSSVLTPVGLTDSSSNAVTDATGEQLYAQNELSSGVLVASPATVDDKSVVAVAWADATPVTVASSGTSLATITFKVNESATVASTALDVVVKADAVDADNLATTSNVVGGTVTLGSDVLYGDVNGDGEVTGSDAALVAQHSSKAVTLDSAYLTAADTNGDGEITGSDAALIAQYASKAITAFPVESK
jgi:hypothetical protein